MDREGISSGESGARSMSNESDKGFPSTLPAAQSHIHSTTSRGQSIENRITTNIWHNPLSVWQTSGTINDRLKQLYFSYMLNERQLCHLITDGLKIEKPAPFDNSPVPGAVGLVRKLDLKNFNLNNELIGHLDHEVSTHKRLNMLQIDEIAEIVDASIRYSGSGEEEKSEFRKNLYSLLRHTDFLSANVDVNTLTLSPVATQKLKFIGSIKGKLGSDAPVKKFTFHAERFTEITCRVPGSAFKLTVGVNLTDHTAFIRLMPEKMVSANFIQYVNEMFIVFNKKPRCSMHVVKHPKSLSGASVDTTTYLFGAVNTNRPYVEAMEIEITKITATPEVVGSETKLDAGFSNMIYFLNKVVPLVRYVQREKGGTGSRIGEVKYEHYLPHFALFTHDLAKLQYTYTVLYSVASALWREVFDTDPSDLKCSWPYLIECIQHFVGTYSEKLNTKSTEDKKENPWNLKSEIALTAVLVSTLYQAAMIKNHNAKVISHEVQAQLQCLYTDRCELDPEQAKRKYSDFGYLLATYAFENSPLHVVSSMDVRNGESQKRTKYGKHQKLYIMKLNTSDDHMRKNHLKRWSLNLVTGSRRMFFFDLQGIMDPITGTDGTRRPMYWRKNYKLADEIELQYKKKDDALISVILDSTHEFNLHMDVFHTNILGVELKDGVEVKKGK